MSSCHDQSYKSYRMIHMLNPYWQIVEIFSTNTGYDSGFVEFFSINFPKIRFPGYESDGFVEIFSNKKNDLKITV